MTPELRQITLLTEEICSDQESLWSMIIPRNFAEKTLVIEIPLVLAWLMESLFALNHEDT